MTRGIRPTDIEPTSGRPYYEVCEACNYGTHKCYFCGEELTHDNYDYSDNHHTVAFCRPDLVEHEVGELCTRPGEWCYWNHDENTLTDKGFVFNKE
jgi:hypothetical protein